MPPICRCDISFFLLLPYRCKRPKKSAGIQRKDSCTNNSCDLLSPYVGIIQIRFWVKASAYSQPACASTPFFLSSCRLHHWLPPYDISFSVIHTIHVMMCCFQQQFHYTHAQKKCKRYFLSAWLFYSSGKYIYHPHILIKRKFFILPVIFVTA